MKCKVYGVNTPMDFGRYQGKTLLEIAIEDKKYLEWLFEEIDNICLDAELFNSDIIQSLPSNIISMLKDRTFFNEEVTNTRKTSIDERRAKRMAAIEAAKALCNTSQSTKNRLPIDNEESAKTSIDERKAKRMAAIEAAKALCNTSQNTKNRLLIDNEDECYDDSNHYEKNYDNINYYDDYKYYSDDDIWADIAGSDDPEDINTAYWNID